MLEFETLWLAEEREFPVVSFDGEFSESPELLRFLFVRLEICCWFPNCCCNILPFDCGGAPTNTGVEEFSPELTEEESENPLFLEFVEPVVEADSLRNSLLFKVTLYESIFEKDFDSDVA